MAIGRIVYIWYLTLICVSQMADLPTIYYEGKADSYEEASRQATEQALKSCSTGTYGIYDFMIIEDREEF